MTVNKKENLWLAIALLMGSIFATLVIRGLSESNLVWLEVFSGVLATMILFIYRDRDKLKLNRPYTKGAEN